MGLIGTFGSLLTDGESATVIECRHCGTTLDAADEQCPVCGGDHVAEFEVA
jgi:rubrerythrin